MSLKEQLDNAAEECSKWPDWKKNIFPKVQDYEAWLAEKDKEIERLSNTLIQVHGAWAMRLPYEDESGVIKLPLQAAAIITQALSPATSKPTDRTSEGGTGQVTK